MPAARNGALCRNRTHILALEGRCSAVELIAHLERAAGVEPTLVAWNDLCTAVILCTRDPRAEGRRPFGGWRSAWAHRRGVELLEGVEPPTRWLQISRSGL